jgi:hypothetical protein
MRERKSYDVVNEIKHRRAEVRNGRKGKSFEYGGPRAG